MSYCINPWCPERQNPDDDNLERCLSCGTELLINERYRLQRPLHDFLAQSATEVWLTDNCGTPKVLKTLTENNTTRIKLFQREAQVLRLLKHNGIPSLETDFIFSPRNGPKKLHCLVMEVIEGENLEEWVRHKGPISQDLALQWLIELTEILDYLHQQQFFHRDIKPSNIMLRTSPSQEKTRGAQLVLIDFGAVRKITGTYLEKMDQGLDTTGVYSIGGYTPAEQLIGRAVPQSDFFSLGRTFVYLLTGKPPTEFENSEMGELIQWKDGALNLSEGLADFIDELMAPDPEKRPRTTQYILQRLDKINLTFLEKSIEPEAKTKTSGFLSRYFTHNTPIAEGKLKSKFGKASYFYLYSLSVLLISSIYFCGGFQPVAIFLYQQGRENKIARKLDKAEFYYNWAVRLYPGYAEAHYNLGSLYEDLRQFDNAGREYKAAMKQGLPEAKNNLGRLEIQKGNYEAAVDWLNQGIEQAKDDSVKYSLYKNLGWARLKQKRYAQAEAQLQLAIALDGRKAAAYCLLAETLEVQKKLKEAHEAWENCLRYASIYNPDEDTWINMAQQRLAGGDKP